MAPRGYRIDHRRRTCSWVKRPSAAINCKDNFAPGNIGRRFGKGPESLVRQRRDLTGVNCCRRRKVADQLSVKRNYCLGKIQ